MATKKDLNLLAAIITAMAVEATPYLMATEAEVKNLAKEGLVETNPDIRDGDKFAVRATDAGVKLNTEQAAKAEAGSLPKPDLTVGTGFVVPEGIKRKKSELYAFDTLDIGGFIFVPKSEAKPDPAKSLASTVSAATKRYSVEIPGQTRQDRNGKTVPATYNTRQFTVVPVKSGVTYGAFTAPSDGAAIVRIADGVKPEGIA